MSRRPVYMKNSKKAYWLMAAFLAVIIWLVHAYGNTAALQYLVDDSELNGRTFQGKAEEITAPKSGVRAFFMQEKSSPLVSAGFIFDRRGTAYDEAAKEGLANLAAMAMTAGAGRKNTETLRDELAVKGIKIGFSADKDAFSGQISFSRDKMAEAAGYLKDILSAPRFEKKYVESLKTQILKTLATEKENPSQELGLAFNRQIFGVHPYGRNPLGQEKTVAALNSDDLRLFAKQKFGRNDLYAGIAGNLSKEEAAWFIDAVFADLPERAVLTDLPHPEINWDKPVLTISRRSGQNTVVFAVKGTCRKCADFYPLYMANYLFGGSGLNSKLNQQIREKEGLTYGGYSVLVLRDKSDLITAGFSATKDKFIPAVKMFKNEWRKTAESGFTAEELQTAKNYLTSSYNLRFTSIAGIAEMLAYMQKYDLGLDFLQKRNGYVEAVTLEQINQVAAKYFTDKMLQAEIGIFDEGEK